MMWPAVFDTILRPLSGQTRRSIVAALSAALRPDEPRWETAEAFHALHDAYDWLRSEEQTR